MSEPKRYQPVVQCVEPSYQAQMIEPKVMEFSEGEYVLHSDYARLKAECQARQAENSVLAVECDSLKAEVDDLKSTADRFKAEVERWEFIHRLDSLAIKKQKEEIERLNEAIVRGAIIPDPKPE